MNPTSYAEFYAGALTARPLALVAEWLSEQHVVHRRRSFRFDCGDRLCPPRLCSSRSDSGATPPRVQLPRKDAIPPRMQLPVRRVQLLPGCSSSSKGCNSSSGAAPPGGRKDATQRNPNFHLFRGGGCSFFSGSIEVVSVVDRFSRVCCWQFFAQDPSCSPRKNQKFQHNIYSVPVSVYRP